MSTLPAGTVRLYDHALPALPPGDWTVRAQLLLTNGGTSLVAAPDDTPLQVTAPRLRLLPEDIVSVWPPAETQEANRLALPHITLRERTLPWARARLPSADSAGRPLPWMALLLLREGTELTLKVDGVAADLTWGDAAKLAQSYPGLDPAEPCVLAQVRQSLLKQLLPLRDEELPWLCHVREVSPTDREAKGDDDGFVAIVLGNRLPDAPDTAWVAVLVSLEALLPDERLFPSPAEADRRPRPAVIQPGTFTRRTRATDALRRVRDAVPDAERAAVDAGIATFTIPRSAVRGSSELATLAVPGAAEVMVPLRPEVLGSLGIDPRVFGDLSRFDPVARLPVLHHWKFKTAATDTDFETLIKALGARTTPPGVALFGAATESGSATGHVLLPHTTRGGHAAHAAYRSPLVPLRLDRGASGLSGAPAVDARQLLRAIPWDGGVREDLTWAAAFEIGRLLALSHRGALQDLAAWRAAWKAGRARRAMQLARPDLLRDTPFSPGRLGVLHDLHLDRKLLDPIGPLIRRTTLEDRVSDPTGLRDLINIPQVPGLEWSSLELIKGADVLVAATLAEALAAPTGWDPAGVFQPAVPGAGAIAGFATPDLLDVMLPQLDDLLLLDPSISGGGP